MPSEIVHNFYYKSLERDLWKLSQVYRKEFLIDALMALLAELYADKPNK